MHHYLIKQIFAHELSGASTSLSTPYSPIIKLTGSGGKLSVRIHITHSRLSKTTRYSEYKTFTSQLHLIRIVLCLTDLRYSESKFQRISFPTRYSQVAYVGWVQSSLQGFQKIIAQNKLPLIVQCHSHKTFEQSIDPVA